MSQPPEQAYPAQGPTLQQPDVPEEEIPTQRIPRVVVPTQSSTQEMAEPQSADSGTVGAEQVAPTPVDPNIDGVTVDPAATDGETVDPLPAGSDGAGSDDADAVDAGSDDAGSDDADTIEMPPVRAVVSGSVHPGPGLPERHVLQPAPVASPSKKRRFVALAVAATALAGLLVGALFVSSRDEGGVTTESVATATPSAKTTVSKPTSSPSKSSAPSDGSTVSDPDERAIQLRGLAGSARPFQAFRIQGTYRGGADTLLSVQRWERGQWLAFPLPTRTDRSGQFTVYVELGQPGRYRLRVLDPDSGLKSNVFVLVIKA